MSSVNHPERDLERRIADILRAYPQIAAAWFFGSEARGEACPRSDIDIGGIFRRCGETALDHHRALRSLAARIAQATGDRRQRLAPMAPAW